MRYGKRYEPYTALGINSKKVTLKKVYLVAYIAYIGSNGS